jgi:hypothetical protein
MLYWLLYSFEETFSVLNVFKYLTFRSGLAALTGLLVVTVFGYPFIRLIREKQFGANP